MAVTAAQLISMVRGDLDEQTAAHYTDDMIVEWLNRAQWSFINGLPQPALSLVPKLIVSVTDTAASVTIPADFVRAVSLTLDGATAPVITPDDNLMDSDRPLKSLDTFGYITNGTIVFNASAVYVLHYLKAPTKLTSSSTTMDFPDTFASLFALLASGLGLIQDKWVSQGGALVQMFQQEAQMILGVPWGTVEGGLDDTK